MKVSVFRWLCRGFSIIFTLTFAGGAGVHAQPISEAVKQDVMISAGDVVLGATLYLPRAVSGKLPGIVTAHGSAPTTRDGVAFYTNHALKMGFAVLSFDKRGTGQSTGTYVPFDVETSEAVFDNLAADLVHAMRWLQAQPSIDPVRTGFLGGSQAGWIMPLAASIEPSAAFIIIGEGVPVTAYEEAVHGTISGETTWHPQTIARADAALRSVNPTEIQGYDPAPVLASIDTPTLWLFGLRDPVIPIMPSLERLEALIRSGKTNHDIHVFPFGDHNFLNVATQQRYDVSAVAEPWLRSKGILPQGQP